MKKQFLLFANAEIDNENPTVSVNQVVQMSGYSDPSYVVYEIKKDQWGINYKLINLQKLNFDTTSCIRPLSQKFGIGIYFDKNNLIFKAPEEVAELKLQVEEKLKLENKNAEANKIIREQAEIIGKDWLEKNLPIDAQAIIIACLKKNKSDIQTDYHAASTTRTVILGFSKYKRDLFSEMRKYASNFEETAYLSVFNEDYEHREKYSMGSGYYLGESKYHGWIIKKAIIYNRENTIKEFSYVASIPDNIYINKGEIVNTPAQETMNTNELGIEIVQYSEKSIALFGDTKPIKDILGDRKGLNGKFNFYLTHNGVKTLGWIFQKSKEDELKRILNLKD
jgi:hypothetical protein